MKIISRLLAHPLMSGLSIDDPRVTLRRRQIIEGKSFLRRVYNDWYSLIVTTLPKIDDVLELGSGAGFLKTHLPNVITSEVFKMPGVDMVVDACRMDFADKSLDAIVMSDVFHHIPDVQQFLTEAIRCLRPSGMIVMIEPWRTMWSEWVYTHLHHEPFLPWTNDWRLRQGGPLTGANSALPWIVFARDRDHFETQFPTLRIREVRPLSPLAYLVSGGVSMRSLLPGVLYPVVRFLERILGERRFAMFALIVLELQP